MPGTHKMPRTHKILLSLAAAVLGLREISLITPLSFTTGSAANLPASYYGVRDGHILYARLSSMAQIAPNDTEGGQRYLLHHWITVYAASAVIDQEEAIRYSRGTGTLVDNRLPLRSPSPVTIKNMKYTKVEVFPLAVLLLVLGLVAYPACVVVNGWLCRRYRRKRNLCQECG